MKKVVAIIKEVLELILRTIPSAFYVFHSKEFDFKKFQKEGYYVLERKLDGSKCDDIINSFELLNKNDVIWKDSTGSDTRLYYAQEHIDEINSIINHELFNEISSKFYGKNIKNKFSLMNKVVPKEKNLGSGGGWHRDSPTSHQLKVLIYLSSVEKGNGQFQLVKNSAKKINIIKSILKYNWGGKYRYSEEDINKYIKEFNTEIIDITGERGTIAVVDTKGIHRGAPIEKGVRYAIFNYYFPKKIPQHLSKYGVNNVR